MEDSTATAPAETTPIDEGDATAAAPRRRWLIGAVIGVIALLGGLVAVQLYLVNTLNQTQDSLAATQAELEDTQAQIADVDTQVAAVGSTVDRLVEQATSTTTPSSAVESVPQLAEGSLPQYVGDGQPDTAVGMRLGSVAGADAYSGETLTIEPSDGRKRVWMVWAHWCPYCQQELPELATAYDDLTASFPDIDIATITTSIDPSRGNPLDEYLEANAFPFPIVVDPSLEVAGQLGVSAFPFWLVTDGDGTVLFRNAGYLSTEQFRSLFVSLDEYDG